MASELTRPGQPALECNAASGALVIGHGAPSEAVRALAANLAADDEYVRVIVDLATDLDGQLGALVHDVLPVLAADPRTPCLIPSSRGMVATTGTGRLIADALGRTVLAHRGMVMTASRGGLFVPPSAGPGWMLLEPGEHGPGDRVTCRLPMPRWATLAALDESAELSAATISQPLPCGVWLHEPRGDASLRQVGRWLAGNLAWADEKIYVLLGHPGAEAIPAADIAAFWATVPERARGQVRFVPFGRVAPSAQELADLLGEPVTMMAGLPVAGPGRHAAVTVRVLDSDGRLVDTPQVPEVHAKPGVPATAHDPQRSPLTPEPPAFSLPSITLESAPAETTGPAATELALSADPADVSPLLPPSADTTVLDDGQLDEIVRDSGVDGYAETDSAVRVQPVPGPSVALAAPARGLAQERQWLHRSLAGEFDAASAAVTRVLAQTPGLRVSRELAVNVLTDLVAARLYLSGRGQGIDEAARTGQVGPHVPFGRCAAEGLRHLPSYRGPARLRVALGEAEWQWYGARTVVTEWAFFPALTGDALLPGSVDFLVWSVSARRADLLAPGGPGQVIFLPGTRFRVLRVRDGQRREVLLRELAPGEFGEDEQVDVIASFDDVAVAGLEKAGAAWLGDGTGQRLTGYYARRFGSPPGLLVADSSASVGSSAAATGAHA